jgi:hypothetical protein
VCRAPRSTVLTALLIAGLPVIGKGPAAVAETPPPVAANEPAALPFSADELDRALAARLLSPEESGALPGAHIASAGPGALTVQVGSLSRIVVIGDRTGPSAARVVALVIAELLSAGAQTASAPAAVAARPPSATAAAPPPIAGAPPATITAAAPPAGRGWPRRLCVTAGATKGTGDGELLADTFDVDLVVALGRRLRLAPSAGLTVMPTRAAGTVDEVSFVGVEARALVGASLGPVDLLAGPVVSRYSIGGATPHDGVLFGAEALARLVAPLSNRLRLIVATRLDAFADRARVHWVDGGTYATPRVGIGVGVGLAWDWSS